MTQAGFPASRAIVGTLATFAGATGLLAAIGFLVLQTQFILVGLPSPPVATTDYLRVAGLFLFDIVVLVILLQALKLVLPAVLALFAMGVWIAATRPSSRAPFAHRYRQAWAKVGRLYTYSLHGSLGLWLCLIAIVIFTFAYHYPVFEQRNVFAPPRACGDPALSPLPYWPATVLWRAVDCAPEQVREIVLDWDRLSEGQAIYRRGVTWLIVFVIYILSHPYSEFRNSRTTSSPASRCLWSVTASLLFLSLLFLPGGYAVLFSQKLAPLVSISFREETKKESRNEPAWQTEIRARDWYLLFQNDKEIWIFRRPISHILSKDQLGLITTQRRDWYLGP
jgi:hypothetical protein